MRLDKMKNNLAATTLKMCTGKFNDEKIFSG
jgi:hypothetical protein